MQKIRSKLHRYLCPVQKTKVQTVVLLGSNDSAAMQWLQKALDGLNSLGNVTAVSGVYASPSWGFTGPDFQNAAARMEVSEEPLVFLNGLLALENQLGRVRSATAPRYTNRTIDLDILLWEEEVVHLPGLEIPHPRLHQRKFALVPLHEVWPDWIHPTHRQSLGTLIDSCDDNNDVTLLPQKLIF
jgi:2-amino-4-hydroxy-6-hydroxymethyldihydropteridine diphosphokinase